MNPSFWEARGLCEISQHEWTKPPSCRTWACIDQQLPTGKRMGNHLQVLTGWIWGRDTQIGHVLQNKIKWSWNTSKNHKILHFSLFSFFFFLSKLTLRGEESWKSLWGLLHCLDGSIHPTPGDFLSIPQARTGCGDTQNIQEPPKNRAREPQTPPGRRALTKPLSSMSYFLPVLLIPHKSSAACWPRSDHFPLLKTSLPRSSLFRDKFRSFLSGGWLFCCLFWGVFFNPFLAKFWGEILQPERQELPHLHQVPPGSGSPTPGPASWAGGWKKWII